MCDRATWHQRVVLKRHRCVFETHSAKYDNIDNILCRVLRTVSTKQTQARLTRTHTYIQTLGGTEILLLILLFVVVCSPPTPFQPPKQRQTHTRRTRTRTRTSNTNAMACISNCGCVGNCSSNGVCVNNACVCNTGWTWSDCSLSRDDPLFHAYTVLRWFILNVNFGTALADLIIIVRVSHAKLNQMRSHTSSHTSAPTHAHAPHAHTGAYFAAAHAHSPICKLLSDAQLHVLTLVFLATLLMGVCWIGTSCVFEFELSVLFGLLSCVVLSDLLLGDFVSVCVGLLCCCDYMLFAVLFCC